MEKNILDALKDITKMADEVWSLREPKFKIDSDNFEKVLREAERRILRIEALLKNLIEVDPLIPDLLDIFREYENRLDGAKTAYQSWRELHNTHSTTYELALMTMKDYQGESSVSAEKKWLGQFQSCTNYFREQSETSFGAHFRLLAEYLDEMTMCAGFLCACSLLRLAAKEIEKILD